MSFFMKKKKVKIQHRGQMKFGNLMDSTEITTVKWEGVIHQDLKTASAKYHGFLVKVKSGCFLSRHRNPAAMTSISCTQVTVPSCTVV